MCYVKNNFKKIKKNIILMCFEMKNTLKSNYYHTSKHTSAEKKTSFFFRKKSDS